jgi:hypothetical protein
LKAQTQANDPELRNIEKLKGDLLELQQQVLVTQSQRVIFTWKAQLGFACKTVLPNDLVCIINGSRTPVVLRRSGGTLFLLGSVTSWTPCTVKPLPVRKKRGRDSFCLKRP